MKNPQGLLIFLLALLPLFMFARPDSHDPEVQQRWVDSTLQKMSLDQKIGQVFMIATFSNKSESHYAYTQRIVKDYHLGGLIFMQGDPVTQAKLINRYQQTSQIPLLIAQDAEWGLNMRLKRTLKYPKNLTLGAIRDDSLVYDLGAQMGKDLKRVGVHLNFAPVVDVNNNAANPVINYRSFGENKYNVARKGILISHGMQDQGVMACAKHFPGHGDTDADSHFDLPVIPHGTERLDTLELYPFMKLIEAGVQSVLVAHLYIPSLDDTPNQATTLSPEVVGGILRKNLRFDGLIVTDALNMHGVTKFHAPGEVALKALQAGNDILLMPEHIPKSIQMIRNAIMKGEFQEIELDKRVRRILKAKYELGLYKRPNLSLTGIEKSINSQEAKILRKKLYESAITLAKNDRRIIPLRDLEKRSIAYVQIGGASGNSFDRTLRKYTKITPFYLRKDFTRGELDRIKNQIKDFNTVVIGVYGMNSRAKDNYGISSLAGELSESITSENQQTILTLFGSPYGLKNFGKENAVIVAYEAVADAQIAAASAIFGGIPVDGKLPVTASPMFHEGKGFTIHEPIRFGFAYPEEEGMDSRHLAKIDSIANHFIRKGATPGCGILVLKGNNIVYEAGFGKTEYDRAGERIDLYKHTYDLASLTKIAATTLCTMHLVERGRLKLDEPISTYLPELVNTNKAKMTIRKLLQHNSGLPGWVPFYLDTYKDEKRKVLDQEFYSYQPTRSHAALIAPSLYATDKLGNWVWEQIIDLDLRRSTSVRYSDIGMIMMQKIVERTTGETLDKYAKTLLYDPLGMNRTYFNPDKTGERKSCPPTEADLKWRNAVIQGFVHDPTAAMLGGVAGHAGLFSNVYDLAKLMHMVKGEGIYGSEYFFRKGTIEYFTRKQLSNSRRGLGWDKPELRANRLNPASSYSSERTYGHTGFTGTSFWVDPDHDLVYIFLSNRTFPRTNNKMLLRENVRSQIFDYIYESIFRYQGISHKSPKIN